MSGNDILFHASNLLKHYEEYGVVICRTCQFAVQPSALASHLLKHQIYRGERRRLLSQLCKLRLQDPNDVVGPSSGSTPVPELPVYKGHSCLAPGCGHVCASVKRMAQHWSDVHGERESRNVKARDCWLQTFFRGNKIRYFEVSAPIETPAPTSEVMSPPASTSTPLSTGSTEGTIGNGHHHAWSPAPILDMAALHYLHHFTTVTSLTLPRTQMESTYHWSITIVNEALKFPFLMYGILGLSAFHLSRTTNLNPSEAKRHAEASIVYQNCSLADFRHMAQRPDSSNAVALIAYARAIGIQRCGRIPDCEEGYNDLSQIVEFLHLIRGSTETLISLQQFIPSDSDFKIPFEEVEYLSRQDDLPVSFVDPPKTTSCIPPDLLERLNSLPLRLYQAVCKQFGDESELETPGAKANISACMSLVTAFERVYSCPKVEDPSGYFARFDDGDDITVAWTGMEYWVRFIPDQYLRLLEERNPSALIIFAYWCVLLRKFESRYWYCQGVPDRFLAWILAILDDDLKGFVADLI